MNNLDANISLRAYLAAHIDVPYDAVIDRIRADYPSHSNARYPNQREIADKRAWMRLMEADALIELLEKRKAQ